MVQCVYSNKFSIFNWSCTAQNCVLGEMIINTTSLQEIVYNTLQKFLEPFQIGLTDLMRRLHILPDHIVGYSLGELVCAYAEGCLTLEETLTAAYYCAAYLTYKFDNSADRTTFIVGTDAHN